MVYEINYHQSFSRMVQQNNHNDIVTGDILLF